MCPSHPMRPEFVAFIADLAEDSGRLIRDYYNSGRTQIAVELKSDASPVTEADRRAEERMRAMIRRRYPDHGIIGEEFGNENTEAEFVWTLDPIDGTIAFVAGCPLFGSLIGLLERGQPVLGAIHQPLLSQLVIGDGRQTRLNGERISVRNVAGLSDATLLTTDFRYVGQYQDAAGFEDLVDSTRLSRTWGDCYGYILVACGGADIMLDPIMNPWDLMPLIPIIRGAGGVITGWDGGDPASATSAVAAPPALHAGVIDVLNRRQTRGT